jgi:hypothetical protein
VVGQRQRRGSSAGLDASPTNAQSTVDQEAYEIRNKEAPQDAFSRASVAKDVQGNGNDICTILQSLKQQLENLRGDVDRLIGKVVWVSSEVVRRSLELFIGR